MRKVKEVVFSSADQFQLINITSEVENFVSLCQIKDGLCFVFAPHATAAIVANEDESGAREDMLARITALAPANESYQHDRIDNNARAHVISAIVGPSVTMPIVKGELTRGTWQDIFFVELDGPRSHRRVIIKVIEG